MDGRGYLEQLIAERLQAGKGRSADARRTRFDLPEIRGIAVGLVAAGALNREDKEEILLDLDETLERAGWLQRRVFQMESEPLGSSEADGDRIGVERPEWRDAILDPPLPTLRGIVPIIGSTLTVNGSTAILISLELWTTMFLLRLAYPATTAQIRHHFRTHANQRWQSWDDTGTTYRYTAGGGSDTHGLFMEHVSFEPAPPDRATTITLTKESHGETDQITVPLHKAT
jgi:hypothetical protein